MGLHSDLDLLDGRPDIVQCAGCSSSSQPTTDGPGEIQELFYPDDNYWADSLFSRAGACDATGRVAGYRQYCFAYNCGDYCPAYWDRLVGIAAGPEAKMNEAPVHHCR